MQYMFFFFPKKIKKIVSFSFNLSFADLFNYTRVRNTVPFELHNIYQRQSWKYSQVNIHRCQSQEYYRKTIRPEQKQTFSNLRQEQQCRLPQVGRLRGDNIFSYYRIFVDQLGFLVTIILDDDSLNQIFFPSKNKMLDICSFRTF